MGGKDELWIEEYADEDPWEDDDKPPATEKQWDFDSKNIRFNRNAGSQTPTRGRCNALLKNWRERYDEPRFCTRIPARYYNKSDSESDYCYNHTGFDGLMQNAKDLMEHGLFTETCMHYFDKIDPVERVYVIGLFEALMDESIYDFEVEYTEGQIDFVDSEYDAADMGIEMDEEGMGVIALPQPQSRSVRAMALLEAAIDELKMVKANTEILEKEMRAKSASEVVEGEGGIVEIGDGYNEHYLNLPYSRLVKDQKENLKRGGIDIEGIELDDDVSVMKRTYHEELPTEDDLDTHKVDNEETIELIPSKDFEER